MSSIPAGPWPTALPRVGVPGCAPLGTPLENVKFDATTTDDVSARVSWRWGRPEAVPLKWFAPVYTQASKGRSVVAALSYCASGVGLSLSSQVKAASQRPSYEGARAIGAGRTAKGKLGEVGKRLAEDKSRQRHKILRFLAADPLGP